MLCNQGDFFKSRVEPSVRSELCIVSVVIYHFVEFDTSVICHVPSSVVCLASFLLQKCTFIAEMYLFNYSLSVISR